ncbi:MAG TPA: bifunctional (p)ppGpp synthetase/guanosine-3',5'-bis(diphosphate) 3'-pyrophosphohydrolase [Polyangiaceae bacterium]|jgi:GTP pyrophosphokinase
MLQATDLIHRVHAYHPTADVELIQRAYDFSHRAHQGQLRKSGDPYFVHPASVAGIITELRLDTASVCAGLLHDVVEDTLLSLNEVEKEFGGEIASLVDGVTKLSKINFTSKEDRQAENFRKMVVAMARDIRVLLVKLCDRVDNMRTLQHMKPEAQERIARETMEIYAPLANRLGIQSFKSELEDLSFKYLEPDAFTEISQAIQKSKRERDKYIENVCKTLASRLAEQGFQSDVTGRAKHVYSIWRKMQEQQCGIDQIHDLIAFRVLVESVSDCYAALGVVHSMWLPVPGRFKDYVALPKPNMYQSLHTTVIGPGRERVEIQIRTHEMHRVAERGIAAHWKYKERGGGVADSDAQKFGWLRQLVEWQKELKDPAEFLEGVKVDLFQDEVYVFTPKGDVRVFPRGASPIDFAYAIHSQLGDHITGARVNGKLEPLRYKLKSGDVLEVLSSPNQHPSKDWLDYAGTTRAKAKIRNYLRAEEREKSQKLGRELLERELHKAGVSLSKLLRNEPELRQIMEKLHVGNQDEFFVLIGYGKISPQDVIEIVAPKVEEGGPPSLPPPQLREGRIENLVRKVTGKDEGGIRLNGIDDVLVRYARCCNPLPGDDILGFITRGRGLTIHRRGCTKAFDTDPERRVDITWDTKAKINRAVQLRVTTANRPGILATVGQTFSAQGINISEANCRAGDDGRAVNVFTFMCTDMDQLKGVMKALQKVHGVVAVERA